MKVVRTRLFERRAREIGLEASRLDKLITRLVDHPDLGDLIPGSGGARKVRIPLAGRGTRGGGRVIYAVVCRSLVLALITVYAKSDQADLSPAERREIATLIRELDREAGHG